MMINSRQPSVRSSPARELGVDSSDSGGRNGLRTLLREQMPRLFATTRNG